MEWLIIAAATALGLIPLVSEVKIGWSEHQDDKKRLEEQHARKLQAQQLEQIERQEEVLMLQMDQGAADPQDIQDELNRLDIARLQVTGRYL